MNDTHKEKISILILAKNEEAMIKDCLKQLSFADEIIVLDQDSSDNTIKIAQKFRCKIITFKEENFAVNRNLLLNNAKNKWVLYLDCDERLSEENIKEIKQTILEKKFSAYYFPRKNIILGKWLKHGGWWPDFVPKLFYKENLTNWTGEVHESPIVNGKYGYMETQLTHLTAKSVNSMLEKTIKWAKIEAGLYYQSNLKDVSALKIIKAIIFEFFFRYFIKLGLLDGVVGLIESIFQSLHQAIILIYLWEKQNKTIEKKPNIDYE